MVPHWLQCGSESVCSLDPGSSTNVVVCLIFVDFLAISLLLDPDPNSHSQYGSGSRRAKSMRIRIHNTVARSQLDFSAVSIITVISQLKALPHDLVTYNIFFGDLFTLHAKPFFCLEKFLTEWAKFWVLSSTTRVRLFYHLCKTKFGKKIPFLSARAYMRSSITVLPHV